MSKIIAVIRNYKNIGLIITPYFYKKTNKYFIEITEVATPETAEKSKEKISEEELRIIKSADAYSDRNLSKIFSKKVKSHDFFKTLTEEDIKNRIRPFIEKQLIKITEKTEKSDVKLYFKKGKFSTLYEEDLIKTEPETAKTVFNISKEENGTRYSLSVYHKNKDITLYGKDAVILTDNPCLLILDKKLLKFNDIDGKKLKPFFLKKEILIPKHLERKWFKTFAVPSFKKFNINPSGFNFTEIKTEFKTLLSAEKDWKGDYAFMLFFNYGENKYQYGLKYDTKIEFNEKDFSFIKKIRDTEKERQVVEYLKSNGLQEYNEGIFKIKYNGQNKREQKNKTIIWLKENIEKLRNYNIEIKQNFFNKKYFTENINLDIKATGNKDWFDIYGTVTFGKFSVPFISLKNNILSNNPEFMLPNGTIAIIPDEWFSKYGDLFLSADEKNDKLKISKARFDIFEKTEIKGIEKSYKEKFIKLLNFSEYNAKIPENINAELRSYQREGFKRMKFLRDAGFGICLADDMGLGKTLQIITLLQDTINIRKKNKNNYSENKEATEQLSLFDTTEPEGKVYKGKASLVIMPVSLIHNWNNEIRKFAPELKVLQYKGADRHKHIGNFDKYDIILAGYATVRNDIELIEDYDFLYLILDESQFIKNSDSKTYKAVINLSSDFKAVMTGTPVENSLSDLWSQMNFINNGMLGDKKFFKEVFLNPVEKENDEISEKKIKSIISPFIIRRTKSEVAKDLPELTEQIIYCMPDEKQKSIYETEKSKIRNILLEIKENKKDKKNVSAEILAALMKLRQIANHPVLSDKNYDGESGKFNEVIRNIENLISENHKVLIFSSFVKHLDLFADYFHKNNIKYSLLTGQTKNREETVAEFQSNKQNKVFLISIKAGGTGLNLTEADYVFILDPWWNPAVEKQAVNRAHRIGQKRNVMVYRFITENSVEEKIMNLQNKKSELAKIITGDNPLGKLSEKELMSFFE